MIEILQQFLGKLNVFSAKEIASLSELLTVKEIGRNDILVKEGQICNLCFFVLKGCLRQYMLVDGIEKTIAFYTEEQAVNFFSSSSNQTPANSYLSSLETSVVLVSQPEKDALIFKQFPQLLPLTQSMMQQDFGQMHDRFAQFVVSSPEERYLNLLNNQPHLLQKVPQHHLASYLGMTPESLSRIKKRIMK